jgi:hypothetical protein
VLNPWALIELINTLTGVADTIQSINAAYGMLCVTLLSIITGVSSQSGENFPHSLS